MFSHALIAFFVLPGMVGGVIPVLICSLDPWRDNGFPVGYLVVGFGGILLLWCVRDFYVSGKGTLAPWRPPQKLVIVGLYRFLRNPMYVSVILILVGWCIASGSRILIIYTGSFAIMFHLRVTRYEELWLAREFGMDWEGYSEAVGRWLPRLKPWFPNDQ